METPHTPEPWHVGERNGLKVQTEGHVFAGRKLIAGCMGHTDNFTEGLRDQNIANAERIVACVNACEGMVDPEATITALRSELVRAEAIISAWVGENATVPQQIRATLALADPSGGGQ